jgi:hypothetical protein
MQQHPVPQNIVNFQFKLVGDMTLKQFGYLAGGIIIGIVASKLPYPAIFNYSLAGIFAFSGFALAFLPIQDRSLDIWVKNFVISIFSPTQFVYKKTGGNLDFLNIDLSRESQNAAVIIEKNLKKDRYRDFLGTLSPIKKNMIDVSVSQYLKSLDLTGTSPLNLPPHSTQSHISQNSANDLNLNSVKVRPLIVKEIPKEIVESSLIDKPAIIPSPLSTKPEPPSQIHKMPISHQFQSINLGSVSNASTTFVKNEYVAPKQDTNSTRVNFDYLKNKPSTKTAEDENKKLEEERIKQESIKQQLDEIQRRQSTSSRMEETNHDDNSQVVDVSSIKRIHQTPQTPKTPNVISGTVTSQRDDPVAGAIIEIKNSERMAVRTLRTNTVGQFAIITPLQAGEYEILIEKPGMTFDIIKIILDNKIVEPLLIKAREG